MTTAHPNITITDESLTRDDIERFIVMRNAFSVVSFKKSMRKVFLIR